ncbi:Nudix family hydrolase [Tahibacter harae]|uniref:8-oxo-dGTP diphosphatase n=1 Tax=Tahibacter harae TaxID=2963937 RepID=A0ABT1QQ41_9GAMM|nr:Nudix family hydrolase [Tahibacter harae]MCQ4164401.1 Nudix family hydrolase [Tahibacter harae]
MSTAAAEAAAAPIHVVAAALIDADGRVLLAQRPEGKHLAGYWEFPGGKVESGESAEQALRREILEEIGVRVGAVESLIRIPWNYASKRILLDVYRVDSFDGVPHSCEGQPLKWVPAAALDPAEMPEADHPVIHALALPREYLITPEPGADTDEFLARLDAALARGVRLVQLRAHRLDDAALRSLATACLARVRTAGGQLLISRRFDLVEELDLDGVHVSAAQLAELGERPVTARRWFAASCHTAAELHMAHRLRADFAVLGTVAATASHPGQPPLGWQAFGALCEQSSLPVFALGGLAPGDLGRALQCGAQGVAGISAFW